MPISIFTVQSILFCVDKKYIFDIVFLCVCFKLFKPNIPLQNLVKIIRLQSYIVSVFENFELSQ